MIRITVPGRPQPKQRPRLGMGKRKAYIYTPPETLEYEKIVGWVAKTKCSQPLEGPVKVEIWVYLRGKADVDNLSKSILDGLNEIAFHDDDQVVDLMVHKRQVKDKKEERVEIRLKEVKAEEVAGGDEAD